MNLLEIVEKIRETQTAIVEIDRKISALNNNKKDFIEEVESVKLITEKHIYFSDLYKNEKQREVAIKEQFNNSHPYAYAKKELIEIENNIQDLGFKKASLSVGLSYYKNLLRVAEIEAIKVKAGV